MGLLDKIFGKLKQTSDVKIFDRLYPYQKDAVTSVIDKEKGIVCMPTGVGKTFCQAAIMMLSLFN